MTRICLLIDTLKVGGKERVMSELAQYFSLQSSLEIHLILYGSLRSIHYHIPDSVHIHYPGFEYHRKRRWIYAIRSLLFVRSKVSKLGPDTILSFGELWNSFVLLALFGLQYPVFISDRCQPDRKYSTVQRYLRKWLYPKSCGVIAQTNTAKQIYHEEFKHDNIVVIGNPIRSIKSVEALSTQKNTVLTVGRLIPGKNHQRLIELFYEIDLPGWQLVIVGGELPNQAMYEKLQKIIRDLGVEEKVILAGEQNNVDAYYQSSQIFAFMSDSEGFPNVIGEAQSAGLPVVAYDCVAGPADMISDGENGFLVPLYDDEVFYSRLQLLMSDEKLRKKLGSHAKKSIKQFSVETIGDSYLSFITDQFKNTG